MCWANWTKEQACCRGTSLQRNGRFTSSRFRKFGKTLARLGRPLRLQRQLSLPNLFYKEHRCTGPWMAQPSALCFSPNRSATAGTQTSQGTTAQVSINSPPLEEPTVGVTIIPAANSRPVTNSLETGPPLSSERHDMGSTAWAMGPACVAARREPFSLPERVLNTMAEARAPSTRCLYARKWSFFLAWCQDRNLEPVTSEVSVVLSFLQEMLDKQRSSSTIKVYTAAIVAFHTPVAGCLVGRDSMVIQFLRGARRMNPPNRAPFWTIAIFKPQSALAENRPAASIGVGQASRRPAGPLHQPSFHQPPSITGITILRSSWNHGWVIYLRCSPLRLEPGS